MYIETGVQIYFDTGAGLRVKGAIIADVSCSLQLYSLSKIARAIPLRASFVYKVTQMDSDEQSSEGKTRN